MLTQHEDTDVVLGGVGQVKDTFLQMINKTQKQKIKLTLSLGKNGVEGLHEAIQKSQPLLKNIGGDTNTKLIEEIFAHLKQGEDDMVCLGQQAVTAAVTCGAARVVLLWDGLPLNTDLINSCFEFRTEVKIFRNTTSDTDTLVKTFGGLAAINRFPYTPLESLLSEIHLDH